MFELANDQRKYFGITPVSSSWDLIKLIPSPYEEHVTSAYFDGNTICKISQRLKIRSLKRILST